MAPENTHTHTHTHTHTQTDIASRDIEYDVTIEKINILFFNIHSLNHIQVSITVSITSSIVAGEGETT